MAKILVLNYATLKDWVGLNSGLLWIVAGPLAPGTQIKVDVLRIEKKHLTKEKGETRFHQV